MSSSVLAHHIPGLHRNNSNDEQEWATKISIFERILFNPYFVCDQSMVPTLF